MLIDVNYLALVQRLSQLLKVIVPDQPMQWVVYLDLCRVHCEQILGRGREFNAMSPPVYTVSGSPDLD